MMSMDIWHAIILTPAMRAWEYIDSSWSTFFCFILKRISLGPIPAKFIEESERPFMLFGSIIPNIRPRRSLRTPRVFFLSTDNPQKVKNIVTVLPVAAAPFASTKDASALSMSFENTMKVAPFPSERAHGALPSAVAVPAAPPFSISARIMPPWVSIEASVFPVSAHQDFTSRAKPGSVALTTIWSPGEHLSISCLSRMIGPGH